MEPCGKGGGCKKQCKERAVSVSLGEEGGLLAAMLDEFQCHNKKAGYFKQFCLGGVG